MLTDDQHKDHGRGVQKAAARLHSDFYRLMLSDGGHVVIKRAPQRHDRLSCCILFTQKWKQSETHDKRTNNNRVCSE